MTLSGNKKEKLRKKQTNEKRDNNKKGGGNKFSKEKFVFGFLVLIVFNYKSKKNLVLLDYKNRNEIRTKRVWGGIKGINFLKNIFRL